MDVALAALVFAWLLIALCAAAFFGWFFLSRSLKESLDTTTTGGRLIFHVCGALVEFERTAPTPTRRP